MFIFIWENAVNVDHTGGDVVIVAENLKQARRLWVERMNLAHGAYRIRGDRRFFGTANQEGGRKIDIRSEKPDAVFPAYSGFVYCGPGGA